MLTPLQVIAIFIGIPLGVALVISLLVVAPGWTRSARRGGSTDWTGSPLWIGETGAANALETSTSNDLGGASARW